MAEDVTVFMGELSLQCNYQVLPSVTLRAGYNALLVSGLALASENFQSSAAALVGGPGSLDHSGRVAYHGPSIGLIFAR